MSFSKYIRFMLLVGCVSNHAYVIITIPSPISEQHMVKQSNGDITEEKIEIISTYARDYADNLANPIAGALIHYFPVPIIGCVLAAAVVSILTR